MSRLEAELLYVAFVSGALANAEPQPGLLQAMLQQAANEEEQLRLRLVYRAPTGVYRTMMLGGVVGSVYGRICVDRAIAATR